MNVDAALAYAEALKRAAEKARAAGRSELTSADLTEIAAVDDKARAELEAAIRRAAA